MTKHAGQFLSATGAALRRFGWSRSGSIAIIFGITIIPILIAAGAAVDFTRAIVVKNRLGQALDAAALAVGASKETDDAVLRQLAKDYFAANYPASELGVPGTISVSIVNKVVTLSGSAQLDTSIMNIAGISKLDVDATVEVVKELRGLEVVMVLDNTGSMNSSGKLSSLKTAATTLVDTLAAEQPDPNLLKFGLVPFAASVNVGSQYENSGWIDKLKKNSLHGIQFKNSKNVFTMYAKFNNKTWNGCVEARPTPYDTQDTVPTTGDTLFVPYFAPDEPDSDAANNAGYWYGNNYVNDNVNNNLNVVVRQEKKNKYNNQTVNSDGPHFNCTNAAVTPLTGSTAQIKSSINSMVASGNTVIPIGLAWGWRLISPEAPFTEGSAYDDNDTDKAIILLTDGVNDIGNLNNHNKSWYNGYGYASQGRLGVTTSSAAHAELNNRVTQLCTNIKNKGITLYTITFKLNDTTTQNLFRNCASDSTKYFNSPSSSDLQSSFEAIAKDLGKLRISK